MRLRFHYLILSSLAAAPVVSNAHMYTQFPAYVRGGLPNLSDWEAIYQDQPGGTWGPVYVNVGHPCGENIDMGSTKPLTSQITTIIPGNNADAQVIEYPLLDGNYSFPPLSQPLRVIGPASKDADGNDWGISTVQAEGIAALPRTYQYWDGAADYSIAPRAITWVGDGIPRNGVGQVVFWVQLPEIPATSCVTDIQYFFPSAQFCPRTSVKGALPRQAWLLAETSSWPAATLGGAPDQWAPYIRVKRDLTSKPLPASCGTTGKALSVYPSNVSIDKFLKPVKEATKFNARQMSVKDWDKLNRFK
jgi:hypothetical protein